MFPKQQLRFGIGGWAICFHFKLCCSAKNSDTNPSVLRDYLQSQEELQQCTTKNKFEYSFLKQKLSFGIGGWALCFHFKLCCSAKNSDTNPGVLRNYLQSLEELQQCTTKNKFEYSFPKQKLSFGIGGWALCFHFKLCCSVKNSDTNPSVLRDYLQSQEELKQCTTKNKFGYSFRKQKLSFGIGGWALCFHFQLCCSGKNSDTNPSVLRD